MVQSITLPNGVTLQCVEHGRASGAPVILLHGLGDSWRSFEAVLTRLPPTIRAVAVTLRGHGDASRPEHYSFETMASDVVQLMDAVGLTAAVVVGHSMGSVVAQHLAVLAPDRVLGLVLIGGFATLEGDPRVQASWQSTVSALDDPVDPAFVRAFQASTLTRPVPASWLDGVVAESLKLPARVWRALWRMHLDSPACVGARGSGPVPTTLLWGDDDAFVPRQQQERLQTLWPGARLRIYAGHGHALHWEAPGRCAADIVASVFERRTNRA